MTSKSPPQIVCIGSVLWDMIGRTERDMPPGADRPGRIQRLPGGVALNIAMALRRFGLSPRLLTHVGEDPDGDALLAAARDLGLDVDFVTRSATLPTDRYMAIEGPEGLVAAVADAHALEAAGAAILAPLSDGRLSDAASPFAGVIALDGNLTASLLAEIAASPLFSAADLRLAPASPGKARRLAPLLTHPRATLYVNLEEAALLSGAPRPDARAAAEALVTRGVAAVLVTDGPRAACAIRAGEAHVALPPPTAVHRVTGAGDTFMAAHIAAELSGARPEAALRKALDAAAAHVAGAGA